MEGDAELRNLYQEALLDYYQSGAHKGKISASDFYSHGINPVCGDELEITMKKGGDGNIAQIRYAGHGCVISQASSAIMAESLEGKSVQDALSLVSAFKDMMLSKAAPESLPEDLEAAKALEGVRRFPTRIKCATLAWNTVAQGLSARGKSEFKEGA